MKLCIPVNEDRGLDSPVCGHFGSAPYFLLVDPTDRSCEAVRNDNQHHEHGRCSPLASLAGRALGGIFVGGIGRGALNALTAAGIPVYRAGGPTAAAVLEALAQGHAERVTPAGACGGHGHHGHGHHDHHDG